MVDQTFLQLAVAVGLGLLVGLQREWTAPQVAGIRTFTLITLLGTLCGQLVNVVGGWIVAAGLLAVAAMLIVARETMQRRDDLQFGLTTQTAAMVMYIAGVALVLLGLEVGAVVGGAVAVLLQWKQPLHGFVQRIGQQDLRAIIQLALIALVVQPLLPDRAWDPYGVVNPYRIWLMVVLICGISVAGYFVYRFVGARAGTILAALLGGVISSTATTVSYSRRSKKTPAAAGRAAFVILAASTVVFPRILLEVLVVAPEVLPQIALPLVTVMGLMTVLSAGLYLLPATTEERQVEIDEDPAQLKAAVAFGLLYALVLYAVAAAKEHFGETGLFLVASLSGLTDVDAITLSTAQMIQSSHVSTDTGWRMILTGIMSNLVFKVVAVAVLGPPRLFFRILVVFGISLAGGGLILAFWPAAA